MKDMGIIRGDGAHGVPLVIGKDTVYVHTDIEKITLDDGAELFRYHEIQYEKDEYIKMMSEKNADLEAQITDVQLVICEIYEGVSSDG